LDLSGLDSTRLNANVAPMLTRELKDQAWIGDAVLALYAREWLLLQPDHPRFTRQELFVRFTSNQFLVSIGEPTQVEARIGRIYQEKGLEAAFAHIEADLKPLFEKNIRNAARGRKGQK
jgi:hypothetical protein